MHRAVYDHHVTLWQNPHLWLHDDGFWLAILLAWTVLGVPVYLFIGRGMKAQPKPLLTLVCGPAVYFIALYKVIMLRKVVSRPPPLPSKSWQMPHGRN